MDDLHTFDAKLCHQDSCNFSAIFWGGKTGSANMFAFRMFAKMGDDVSARRKGVHVKLVSNSPVTMFNSLE